jgi:hypothetical protein
MEFPATAQFLEAALYLSKVLEKASDEKNMKIFSLAAFSPISLLTFSFYKRFCKGPWSDFCAGNKNDHWSCV